VISTSIGDKLQHCAEEMEAVADVMAEKGIEAGRWHEIAAGLQSVAEDINGLPNRGQELIRRRPLPPGPRPFPLLEPGSWDFKLPGCRTFGYVDGLTDAEVYQQGHDQLVERLSKLEPVDNIAVRRCLLNDVIEQWPEWDEERDGSRYRAAATLIGSLGSYMWLASRDKPNDAEQYESFRPIPALVWALIGALDQCEYYEYSGDQDGATSRQVRDVKRHVHELADAVDRWAESL
jgi:hypothetical protein